MASVEDPKATWRYAKELPADKTNLAKAWKLLETYSGIPSSEIETHVSTIRDKAFAVFHYPCIGRWRFLDLYITSTPEYPAVISRLQAGETLLDVGCCFGQILRQLAVDGAPQENLTGTDLRPEFIELGYELFRDKDRFGGQFVAGNILDDATDGSLRSLDGKFNIIHTASFFHLFGWDDQVKVGERIVRFLKPDAQNALVLGRQVGSFEPLSLEEYREKGERRYHHNVETLQKLWNVIGDRTGTQWKVSGELFESGYDDAKRVIIRFSVHKVV
ncbi:S-adenosyl-L-methionine-dependent methyltransferase [Pleurostoma richardsiae]|uniref:S-adenosyl-L-methionine-dependent methyltransferase n=1 Tax=Pleurostoma richardsiae TaxID=41990 RepID=A0AA38VL21_9PEZI|nr:S-adenosyl-L-methionine-dependent methyltransferase [Pleurostoma richardsiae]